jgi:DNA (cytosine-5)-methyltransferase 1
LGAFPLAAVRHGITPVWASEIEKAPIAISKKHFPDMLHLGDIAKIDGRRVPPVDIITFGSPCQDLSVAGTREGINGSTRSGLFLHAVRIIREMRLATCTNYPRFAVWENVPGAFSSNRGKDFRLVLSKLAQAKIPMPGCGKWANAGMVRLAGREIAWRVLDAQYWGVPQRRRRIFLVADFGGQRAGEILFEPEGLRGDIAPGQEAGESPAAPIGGGAGGTGCDGRGGRNPAGIVCHDARGNGDGLTAPAITGDHNGRVTDYTAIVAGFNGHRHILRRLTPTECERLMGLPDGWTAGHSDTARYKAIGNSVAVPCAEFIMRGLARIIKGAEQ